MIVLLLLSLTYIPVTSSILTMMNCQNKVCEAGKNFYEEMPELSKLQSMTITFNTICFIGLQGIGSSFIKKNGTAYCSACSFLNKCNIVDMLCPASSDTRMVEDLRFSCSSEINIYYTPGAALMLLSYTLGVPCKDEKPSSFFINLIICLNRSLLQDYIHVNQVS